MLKLHLTFQSLVNRAIFESTVLKLRIPAPDFELTIILQMVYRGKKEIKKHKLFRLIFTLIRLVLKIQIEQLMNVASYHRLNYRLMTVEALQNQKTFQQNPSPEGGRAARY